MRSGRLDLKHSDHGWNASVCDISCKPVVGVLRLYFSLEPDYEGQLRASLNHQWLRTKPRGSIVEFPSDRFFFGTRFVPPGAINERNGTSLDCGIVQVALSA